MKNPRLRKRLMAGILGAALAQGCIENPEPDSRLGWARRTARAAELYLGGERLEFRLFEERDGIRLFVTNSGTGMLDSAEFFLELGEWDGYLWHTYFRPAPQMQYFGKVGPLMPGEEADFGIIDFPVSGDLSDYDFKATVLKASEGGADAGHALRGLYAGTFAIMDTGKDWRRGPMQAMIDGEGRFGFLETGNQAGDWRIFTGFYAEGRIGQGDSASLGFMKPEYFNRLGLIQLSGNIRSEGDSLLATFLLGTRETGPQTEGQEKPRWVDSISIRLHPIPPRERWKSIK